MSEQKPSVGRIVHYHDGSTPPFAQPQAAIITRVWSDVCINITVFCEDGGTQHVASLYESANGAAGRFGWSWPPRV